MREMPVTVIVGEQRGDEAKGRFTDMLAEDADIVGRGQGGPNAGHTVVTDDGRELNLHSVPSGIAYEHTMNIIGRGCLIHTVKLVNEMIHVRDKGFEVSPDNLMINSGTHLILPHHVILDALREADPKKMTGSTKSGISPTAGAKYGRRTDESIRAQVIKNDPGQLYDMVRKNLSKNKAAVERAREKGAELDEVKPDEQAEEYVEAALKLGAFITDSDIYLQDKLADGARVVAEGAQGFWLDPDHGMWPDVTSTSTTAAGLINGLGIPLSAEIKVIGVSKLVQTSVGGGPFVTEVKDNPDAVLRLRKEPGDVDGERGKTTNRDRDIGYLSLPDIRRAQGVNGTSEMYVAKLDDVSLYGDTVKICTSYTRTKMDDEGVLTSKIYSKAPDAAYKLYQCTPNYVELPTWKEDIQGVRKFEDLPKNAQDYILFIEKQLGVPITMIGVGPARDQVIDRTKTR